MGKKKLKLISVIMLLVVITTIVPFSSSIQAEAAEDTTWTVINYSTMTDANLSAEDIALMHEDNWLNQQIASDRAKTVATLNLADFLSYTTFTHEWKNEGSVPESIKFMTNLTMLKLSGNKLDYLPSYVGNLFRMRSLIVPVNNLTYLPDSLSNMKGYSGGLYELSVQSNYLTTLPSTLTYVYSINCEYNLLVSGPTMGGTYKYSNHNFYNHYQLSLSNTEDLNLRKNNIIDKSSVINTLIAGTKEIPQSVVDQLQVVADDPTIIDSTGKALKVGITNIRLALPGNPASNPGGITQESIKVTVYGVSATDVDVTFNQADTIELTSSGSEVDFQDVSGVDVTSDKTNLVVAIKSSLPYSVQTKVKGDFKNSEGKSIPVNKLSVGLDAQTNYTNLSEVNSAIDLLLNASNTSTLENVKRTHVLHFKLDRTIGYKAGEYSMPLEIIVTQQ